MDAIVTFHSIDDSGSVLSVPPGDLDALLTRLRADDVRLASLDEILTPAPAVGAGERSRHRVALTFDDGLRSVHRAALPILRRHGAPAVLYVVSDWVGRDNRWPTQPAGIPRLDLMTWDELGEWRDAGLAIGAHTASHVPLTDDLAADQWAAEIAGSGRCLEERLEIDVRHFAYPYGTLSATAVDRVRQSYDTAVTTTMSYLTAGAPRHLLPRLDAYYLQARWARAPLFAATTRAYLGARAWLRKVRHGLHSD